MTFIGFNRFHASAAGKVCAGDFLHNLTDFEIMQSYRDRLSPWAVFRCRIPEANNICVARFKNRRDADDYLKILRQLTPDGDFKVIFDREESNHLIAHE